MTRGYGKTATARLRLVILGALLTGACGQGQKPGATAGSSARASILLVTLDTTRADAIGPEATDVETPAFDALAGRGRRFRPSCERIRRCL